MNPSLYYWIGICIFLFILAYYHKRKITVESFYTFFIPRIVAPEDPYPQYVTDSNARSLMRFYPENPRAVFWLWDAPDGIVNPWEWLRPFFAWMSSTVPLHGLEFRRSKDVNRIMNQVSKNQNHMALLPSWRIFEDFTKNRESYVSAVMNLFGYSLFAIVPYGNITDPNLQFSPQTFATGTKWAVGPTGGLSDYIARRIKNIWFVAETNINEVSGTTGPEIINAEWDECFNQMKNNQINGMFWCDVHPFPLWQKAQDSLPKRSFILIPIQRDRQEILYTSIPFLQRSYFDLETYDRTYLPMRVGPRLYWAWNSSFETVQFPAVWIANPNYSRKDIYLWLYTFMNTKRFRQDSLLKASRWTQGRAFYFGYMIPIHPATEQYRINHGLDSQQEDAQCVLYAGSRTCPVPNPLGKREIPPAFQPTLEWPTTQI